MHIHEKVTMSKIGGFAFNTIYLYLYIHKYVPLDAQLIFRLHRGHIAIYPSIRRYGILWGTHLNGIHRYSRTTLQAV